MSSTTRRPKPSEAKAKQGRGKQVEPYRESNPGMVLGKPSRKTHALRHIRMPDLACKQGHPLQGSDRTRWEHLEGTGTPQPLGLDLTVERAENRKGNLLGASRLETVGSMWPSPNFDWRQSERRTTTVRSGPPVRMV